MNILIYSTSNPATFGGLHFVTLQMKGERTKIIPTQNQPLRKTYECVGFGATNPLPAILSMERKQARTQNHVSIA